MYAEFKVHRTMIRDRVRTKAFRRAVESVVRPGDVVLDVGAGSGILSLFAARAGAAPVYAVERTTVAVLAQVLAAANGARGDRPGDPRRHYGRRSTRWLTSPPMAGMPTTLFCWGAGT